MIINFVGIFNQPGYVGEVSDETHIARELQSLGHTVNRIQRDIWKAFCDGEWDEKWDLPKKADINLIAKWHHFNDGGYISKLKTASEGAPVFYWVWDFMPNPDFPDWHIAMAKEADLYLSGEAGIFSQYKERGVKPYYFQMDVCDGEIETFRGQEKRYDVVFTGSCIDQGHRKEWLLEINKEIPVTVFSWNPEEWFKLGIKECYPAVYGEEYNKIIAQSKIVLGFNVEPNCYGYWSNRVGKVLRAGGFLLQEYAPGMEQLLPKSVRFFSTPQEAVSRIKYELEHEAHRKARELGFDKSYEWTSRHKASQLTQLMERYLKGDPSKWLL